MQSCSGPLQCAEGVTRADGNTDTRSRLKEPEELIEPEELEESQGSEEPEEAKELEEPASVVDGAAEMEIVTAYKYYTMGTKGLSHEISAIFYKNHQYVKFLTISACYFWDDLLK